MRTWKTTTPPQLQMPVCGHFARVFNLQMICWPCTMPAVLMFQFPFVSALRCEAWTLSEWGRNQRLPLCRFVCLVCTGNVFLLCLSYLWTIFCNMAKCLVYWCCLMSSLGGRFLRGLRRAMGILMMTLSMHWIHCRSSKIHCQTPQPQVQIFSSDDFLKLTPFEVERLLGEVDAEEEENMGDILLDQALGIAEEDVPPDRVAGADDRPVAHGPSESRKGNSIYVGGRSVGSICYLLHWDPPSYSAQCKLHAGDEGGCYCTADISKVKECELEEWLMKGPRFLSAKDHLAVKPAGVYNRRRDKVR